MNSLAKYSKWVLASIVAFFVLLLLNNLVFTYREGLETPTLNELQTEMVKLKSDLTTLEKVASINQSKLDSLKKLTQKKQTEIDKIQSEAEVSEIQNNA